MHRAPLTRYRGAVAVVIGAALLGACSQQDGPLAPGRSASGRGGSHDVFAPQGGVINLNAMSLVPGDYGFHLSVVGGGEYVLPGGADRTLTISEQNAQNGNGVITYAYAPANVASWPAGVTAKVTITETSMPAGMRVDSMVVWIAGVPQYRVIGTNSVTVTTGFYDEWYVAVFNGVIPTPPPVFNTGYSACPVGFWKRPKNLTKWSESGLSPTQLVGTLFAAASQYKQNGKSMAGLTLVEGLKANGDGGLVGAAEKLIRTGIATELNARRAGWNFPMTPNAVIDAVNNTLATHDRKKMRAMASTFRKMNKSNKANVDDDDDNDDDDPAVSCPLR